MIRQWALLTLFAVLSTAVPAASTGYNVAGTISGVDEEGTLYVAIFDRRAWNDTPDFEQGYVQGRSYPVDAGGTVSYRFEDVPAGVYAIRAFLDQNGNEDLDMGMLGPREPWGVYEASGRILGPPRFDNLAFEVESDVADANFRMR